MKTDLIKDIKKYFEKKEDYVKLFINYNIRSEGWFQGELVKFLSSSFIKEKYQLSLLQVGKPCKPLGKRKPDLVLKMGNTFEVIELKAISIQTWRTLKVYFKRKEGLATAFKMLGTSKVKEHLLIFAYPLNDLKEWQEKAKETEKNHNIKQVYQEIIKHQLLISLWENSPTN